MKTDVAVKDAALDATFDMASKATWKATRKAVENTALEGTLDEAWDATWTAVRNATYDATRGASLDATWDDVGELVRSMYGQDFGLEYLPTTQYLIGKLEIEECGT